MNSSYQVPYEVQTLPIYGYDNSEALDSDCAYMKEMYPCGMRCIQQAVEEECDMLEYEGSCMFDEYPDRVYTSMISERICRRIDIANVELPYEKETTKDLIFVMLFQEMQHRRRRYRSRKIWC